MLRESELAVRTRRSIPTIFNELDLEEGDSRDSSLRSE